MFTFVKKKKKMEKKWEKEKILFYIFMLFTTANTKLGSVSVDVLFCNYDKVTPLWDLTPSTDKTYEKKVMQSISFAIFYLHIYANYHKI